MKYMTVRANIELYDLCEEGQRERKRTFWKKGSVLYHHYCGFPSWMGPKLESLLQEVRQELDRSGLPHCWESKRVADLIVKLSADDPVAWSDFPCFLPSSSLDFHIVYLWRIFLGPSKEDPKLPDGKLEIQCFSVECDLGTGIVKNLEPVNWRQEVKRQQGR
jgi:hypothetical protein